MEIPEHIDTYLLDREIEACDLTALEAVMKVDDEKVRLEKEAEQLLTASPDDTEAQARLEDVYERYVIILVVFQVTCMSLHTTSAWHGNKTASSTSVPVTCS